MSMENYLYSYHPVTLCSSFIRPKHNIYVLSWFVFDSFDLILLVVCQICHWIVKEKIENKQNLFLKNGRFITLHWMYEAEWQIAL